MSVADDVEIGSHCHIGGNPEVSGSSRYEREYSCKVGRFAKLGNRVEVSRGTEWDTTIEEGSLVMANVVVGHDVRLGHRTIISSGSLVAGHAVVFPFATLGLGSLIHQRSKISLGAMVGMGATVRGAVGSFQTVAGNPARVIGRNWRMASKLSVSELPEPFSEESLRNCLTSNPKALAMYLSFCDSLSP